MKKTIFITLFLISFSSAIFANDSKKWRLNIEDQSSSCKSIIQPGGNKVGIVADAYLVKNGKLLKGNSYWGGLKGKIRSGNKVGLNSIDYNFSGVIEGNKIRITKINPLDSNTYTLDQLKKFKKNNCKIIFTNTSDNSNTNSETSTKKLKVGTDSSNVNLNADSNIKICKYLECYDDFFKENYKAYWKVKSFKAFAIAYDKDIKRFTSIGFSENQSSPVSAKEEAIKACEVYKDKSDKCHILFVNAAIVNADLLDLMLASENEQKYICVDRSATLSPTNGDCSTKVEWRFKSKDFINGQLKEGALGWHSDYPGVDLIFRRFEANVTLDKGKTIESPHLSYAISRSWQFDSCTQFSRLHMCQSIWNKEWTEIRDYKGDILNPKIYEEVFCSQLKKTTDLSKSKIYCQEKMSMNKRRIGKKVFVENVDSKLLEKYKVMWKKEWDDYNPLDYVVGMKDPIEDITYCFPNVVTITKNE